MPSSKRIVVTGSSGHLGDALVRVLRAAGEDVLGVDVVPSPWTDVVGTIVDRGLVRRVLNGAGSVLHAATLHKPHVGSHTKREFIDTNVTGTLNLLEEAVAAGVERVVFTSTTSTFGRALAPAPGAPAAWITEDVTPVVRNVYGASKCAAEDLCELAYREHGLPVIVLRTSRFFPEGDDNDDVRGAYSDANVKLNELLYRRVDIEDVVTAHRLALERAAQIGFGRYIISATTPFSISDCAALRADAPSVVARLFPSYPEIYERLGWHMFPSLDRVYVNERARKDLGWAPRCDFAHALDLVSRGLDARSALAVEVGSKGYHAVPTGVYTTNSRR